MVCNGIVSIYIFFRIECASLESCPPSSPPPNPLSLSGAERGAISALVARGGNTALGAVSVGYFVGSRQGSGVEFGGGSKCSWQVTYYVPVLAGFGVV